MQTFLFQCIDYLKSKYDKQFKDLVIILPNRRAKVFLKKYISDAYDKPVWAPEMLTSEELVERTGDLKVVESVRLLIELYRVHKEIEKEKPQSFEEFVGWGQTLIHDFNELDLYLLNVKSVFSYLSDARAIERWHVDNKELTDFEIQYLRFYNSLYQYYEAFKAKLVQQGLAWQGLAFRNLAENAKELLCKEDDKQFVFIGFNALTACEERILDVLLDNNKAEVLWDADNYYYNDGDQEAGYFIRRWHKQRDKKLKTWFFDEFNQVTKDIQVYGVSGGMGIAQLGANLMQENHDNKNPLKTAVVLADENLIFPVLRTIPKGIDSVNVTMGLPMNASPVFDFFDALFNLHINTGRFRQGKGDQIKFYYKDLEAVFNHFLVIAFWMRYEKEELQPSQLIRKREQTFYTYEEILEIFKNSPKEFLGLIKALLNDWSNAALGIQKSIELILLFKEAYDKPESTEEKLTLEYLFALYKIFNQIADMVKEDNPLKTIQALKLIYSQLGSTEKISFIGEPLKGIQVMGVLETRLLDFERVILLSVNEDKIPKTKQQNSFIPFDIKREFGLPTHTEKDAIYAYHFYRLLQRSSKVDLVYNSQSDALGGGDRSRYISQLLYEFQRKTDKGTISENLVVLEPEKVESSEISIKKDDEIMKRIEEIASKGFSPTALINYAQCPFLFYLRNVLKVNEDEEVEESIDARTMGTVIHEVLEDFYRTKESLIVSEEDINSFLKNINDVVYEKYKEYYKANDFTVGKNHLIVAVTLIYLKNFLQQEKTFIQSNAKDSRYLRVEDIEKELKRVMKVHVNDNDYEVKYHGFADRIDKLGDVIRVLDYKTGLVEDDDVKISSMEDMTEKKFKPKVFQLLMYAWLYQIENVDNNKVESGIYSLRKKSKVYFPLLVNKEALVTEELLGEFEELIAQLTIGILDRNINFCQTEDLDKCSYCNYKTICNRHGK